MSLTLDDLRYEKDPKKRIDEERVEIRRQQEEGEIDDEDAEGELEALDLLEGRLDEAGRPPWRDDADDPENWGDQSPT